MAVTCCPSVCTLCPSVCTLCHPSFSLWLAIHRGVSSCIVADIVSSHWFCKTFIFPIKCTAHPMNQFVYYTGGELNSCQFLVFCCNVECIIYFSVSQPKCTFYLSSVTQLSTFLLYLLCGSFAFVRAFYCWVAFCVVWNLRHVVEDVFLCFMHKKPVMRVGSYWLW